MKTLYTCGCSFMSSDLRFPAHRTFLEQYADQQNLEHISLAVPGATNYHIRMQVDWAIQQKADYVIVGATSSDRLDLIWNTEEKPWLMPMTIEHAKHNANGAPLNYPNANWYMISDTINNLVQAQKHDIGHDRREALKTYTAFLHEHGLQQHIDRAVIRDALFSLSYNRIPYLFIPGPMFFFDWNEFNTWPQEYDQPWSMPHGIDHQHNNHNPDSAHTEFLDTLNNLIPQWGIDNFSNQQ